MPTTDEELATKRERVEELRQQVADEQNARATREIELANDVQAAQLDVETTRLEAQLAEAKRANGDTSTSSVAGLLDAAKADQDRADASLEAVNTPTPSDEPEVDTSGESENDETKG